MRRSISLLVSVTLSTLAVLAGASLARAAEGDIAGSSDYPGIARFAGSVITGYDTSAFGKTRLQTAPFARGDATADLRPQGRVTRIAYRTGPGPTMLEVSRAFETQLTQAGYERVFACDAAVCGGIDFSMGVDVMFIPRMWVNGVNYHYFVGRKSGRDGAETWATVLVSHHLDTVTAQLVVTEVGAAGKP